DPLNPLPPASESEPNNEIEVENPIEHKDETIPVSVYEVGKSSTAAIPQEDELTYPYEEVDPLNPLPPASESEPNNEIEVENPIEHEDETVPVSVYEVGESSTAAIP
ncbi:hypothetical protein Tco_0338340, partial [Tanacetum coccineum]